MKVRGILCGTTAATNEEYRKVLKRRNIWMIALAAAGILIAGAAAAVELSGKAAVSEHMTGVFCGIGTGFVIAGVMLFVRNLILLKDEEKLKQSRLENSDERLQEIGNKAVRTAMQVLFLAGTAAALIGGMYEPVLIKALIFMLDLFLFSYLAAFAFYQKRM